MERSKLRAAILIVSDTASQDPSTDKAGDVLSDAFIGEGGDQWAVEDKRIIPDDALAIQREVSRWCDGEKPVNLVVTTGGTGFAIKDNTPEAINPLIHRHASGLVHGMLTASLEVTPFALMSRPVAGVRSKTLIITLPGSPKGAKENLLSILKLLPHACLQAAGADSRVLHAGGTKKLEKEAGVSSKKEPHSYQHHHDHSHGHGHAGHGIPKAHTQPSDRPISNDPRAGPTSRYRESPYPMLSVEEALKIILEKCPASEAVEYPVDSSLVGHILAEDVIASEAVPAYRASIVDGYAVIVSPDGPSTEGVFPVSSVSHATPGETPTLQRGQIARITTGAPLPFGANAVVMVEDTALRSMTNDGTEEKTVEILTDQVKPNENIREIGSDVRAGATILHANEAITATGGEIGLLASVGKATVPVYRKPTIGILSTGSELTPHTTPAPLPPGTVRDTNRPALLACLTSWGYPTADLGMTRDTPTALESTLRAALNRVDCILTTGGVSMGELDLLKPTLERALGGTTHFGRVAVKPGKPTTFCTVPHKTASGAGGRVTTPVFALPGNPASALVMAHLFVMPALQKMGGGLAPWGMPRVMVCVRGGEVRCDPRRREYHRVGLRGEGDGRVGAWSTGVQRSSRVGSLRGAGGLLCLPAKEGVVGEGEMVECLVMGGLEGLGD